MRQSAIRLLATFGPFDVVPEKAWSQAKAAAVAIFASYGFNVVVQEDGEPNDAYRRWFKWLAEQDEAVPVVVGAPKCVRCDGTGYTHGDLGCNIKGCMVDHGRCQDCCGVGTL